MSATVVMTPNMTSVTGSTWVPSRISKSAISTHLMLSAMPTAIS
jgi:hypothetical protein